MFGLMEYKIVRYKIQGEWVILSLVMRKIRLRIRIIKEKESMLNWKAINNRPTMWVDFMINLIIRDQ